ncbi:MbcA/ParS/Xre antitoxin family protein [Variovorax sp. LjRoot175]|uniref:hypothetical protein n=1 Tax=Variovorax sp. LjRoot175 TaxID=3342276 RepID=UPI003ECCF53C
MTKLAQGIATRATSPSLIRWSRPEEVFGGKQEAEPWMSSRVAGLDGSGPVELLETLRYVRQSDCFEAMIAKWIACRCRNGFAWDNGLAWKLPLAIPAATPARH